MTAPKFVQITVWNIDLYALDEDGGVWSYAWPTEITYERMPAQWRKLSDKRVVDE